MAKSMVDYLFLAVKFNRYAGPNNHLLDLSNYLYTKSKKSLVLATHSGVSESDFLKEIQFPIVKILERAAHVISNVKAIRTIVKKLSPRKIFVNCDANLAFQTLFATNKRPLIGYNVFLGGTGFRLDRYLFKSVYAGLLDKVGSKILVKKIVAHTNWHREAYLKIGIKPSKITVIPHCVDSNRIHRSLERDSKIMRSRAPVIMFLGRLKKIKGILELFRAYEQISTKTDANLMIVGGGPLERRVREMKKHIERKNTRARITHMKRVSLARLMTLMKSADVIAIPSYYEPFGLVALEAMSLKKAVLTTCFGGISEVITNGINGVLVNPFDSHALQSRLEELLVDRSERVRLGNAAYQTIKNNYEVSVVAPRFVKFLEESD